MRIQRCQRDPPLGLPGLVCRPHSLIWSSASSPVSPGMSQNLDPLETPSTRIRFLAEPVKWPRGWKTTKVCMRNCRGPPCMGKSAPGQAVDAAVGEWLARAHPRARHAREARAPSRPRWGGVEGGRPAVPKPRVSTVRLLWVGRFRLWALLCRKVTLVQPPGAPANLDFLISAGAAHMLRSIGRPPFIVPTADLPVSLLLLLVAVGAVAQRPGSASGARNSPTMENGECDLVSTGSWGIVDLLSVLGSLVQGYLENHARKRSRDWLAGTTGERGPIWPNPGEGSFWTLV